MSTTTDAPPEGEPLVRDIMTTPVITVPPTMTVKDLAALFRDKRIGGVPVVDEDRLVGIVTEGDLMAIDADVQMPHYFELFDSIIYLGSQKKFKEQLEKASAATVEQLMTDDVKTVASGRRSPRRRDPDAQATGSTVCRSSRARPSSGSSLGTTS